MHYKRAGPLGNLRSSRMITAPSAVWGFPSSSLSCGISFCCHCSFEPFYKLEKTFKSHWQWRWTQDLGHSKILFTVWIETGMPEAGQKTGHIMVRNCECCYICPVQGDQCLMRIPADLHEGPDAETLGEFFTSVLSRYWCDKFLVVNNVEINT